MPHLDSNGTSAENLMRTAMLEKSILTRLSTKKIASVRSTTMNGQTSYSSYYNQDMTADICGSAITTLSAMATNVYL